MHCCIITQLQLFEFPASEAKMFSTQAPVKQLQSF